MKSNLKSILVLVSLVLLVVLAVSLFSGRLESKDNFTYGKLNELLENNLVTSLHIDTNLNAKVEAYKPKTDDKGNFVKDEEGNLVLDLDEYGEKILATYTYRISYQFQLERVNDKATEIQTRPDTNLTFYQVDEVESVPWYLEMLPQILISVGGILLMYFLFLRPMMGGAGKASSFGKARAKVIHNDKDAVKFADVAGADEEKAELEEVVEFLKDPTKFVKLGARIPRGVLLVGPPGTGKTLLAKAVAGEAGVPFFSLSGSDFMEMYVGVGASRVRDLFDSARKFPASIIFIDEIDAIGRHRGAGLGGGHDEREQTLNQLLVEMDGFGTSSGVIVMAATNRPDILDPALLRPGRFDRRVTVNYPDIKGREAILRVHTRNKPLEQGVDLGKIAQTTIGFTGADLANLMNEAALRAARRGKALIGMDDIEESYMKMLLGPRKRGKVRTEKDNKLCAYHEAGHAVASYFCDKTDPIKHITIIPAGNTGGVTLSVPTEDRMGATRGEMLDRIVVDLGGRVAEEIVLDDISTGASSDIQQATAIANKMVTRYGMSDKLGTVLYGSEHSSDEIFLGRDFSSGKNYSEKTAAEIDEEVRRIIKDSYERCKKYLTEHVDKLHFVAEFLLKYESMDEEQFRAAMETENPTIEDIANIADEKRRQSEEENKTAHENNEREEAEKRERERAEAEERAKAAEADGKMPEDEFFDLFSGKNDSDKK